jgi:predicted amidohydrolase
MMGKEIMIDALPIGVLHLDVKHGRVDENREALARYALEAARRGAKIIVAPELAVSGYSFENRNQVAACVETLAGPTFERLSHVAKRYGAYICAGIVEQDPKTHIYYNTALVVGPDGELTAHHRKVVSAERRWACPGGVSRSNIFVTPWGRVGVLICADSYFGLLPRSLALNGVDLLLVLANWPSSGVDPRLIWRARALENGFGVVGCNRTGVDRIMDYRSSRSYVVTSAGEVLLDDASATSNVWMVDYPLVGGRMTSESREAMMARRRPEDFADLYLDVNGLDDFGGLWGLPSGGSLDIRCLVAESQEQAFSAMESAARECDTAPMLLILPERIGPLTEGQIARLVDGRPLAIIAQLAGPDRDHLEYGLVSSSQLVSLPPGENAVTTDFGTARIALARPKSLIHPEVAVSLSKRGCDLIVTSPDRFDPDDRLLFGVKCLERAAIAVATLEGAMICEPPVGHMPWKEQLTTGLGLCSARIDTVTIRSKRFHDRVDMEALLRR